MFGVTKQSIQNVPEYTARQSKHSPALKAEIIAEIADPSVNIQAVSRRTGLSPNLLYGWRSDYQKAQRKEAGITKAARPFADILPKELQEIAEALNAVADILEETFGFKPSHLQTIKYLIKHRN